MMTPRIFIPRDAGALSLGSDAVEQAIVAVARNQGMAVEIVRTGSRGLFWLEPMIEGETTTGRIAYGPVTASDIPGLLTSGLLTGGEHPLRLGVPEELPFLARQTRL